jgi:hypothetical protein
MREKIKFSTEWTSIVCCEKEFVWAKNKFNNSDDFAKILFIFPYLPLARKNQQKFPALSSCNIVSLVSSWGNENYGFFFV